MRVGTKRSMCAAVGAALLLGTWARAQEPVEPVHFSKLLAFLPDSMAGYVAGKPEGSTSSAMGFKLTQVGRLYHKGTESSDEAVTIKITDGAGNQFFAAAHAMATKFSKETADGYEKGFTLDSYPAIERYRNETRQGSLNVFIADRFLVEITASNLESATLQQWWKRIDTKKLAELKP